MLINLKNKKAISLTELIIASAMIGIVMLGMASVDFATRQAQISTSRNAFVATRVGAMMIDLTKNASLAMGDAQDVGIRSGTVLTVPYLCFRQDVNASYAPNNTPSDYSDDYWECYTLRTGFFANFSMARCHYTVTLPCIAGVAGGIEIGRAQSFTYTYTPSTTGSNLQNYVEMTITSRYDHTTASDPLKNPTCTMTSRVTPMGQSLGYAP